MAQKDMAEFVQHDVNAPRGRALQIADDAMAGSIDPLASDTIPQALHSPFLEDQMLSVLRFDSVHQITQIRVQRKVQGLDDVRGQCGLVHIPTTPVTY
ncbi:hypothetical protein D9M72_575880 [compost metagenome]